MLLSPLLTEGGSLSLPAAFGNIGIVVSGPMGSLRSTAEVFLWTWPVTNRMSLPPDGGTASVKECERLRQSWCQASLKLARCSGQLHFHDREKPSNMVAMSFRCCYK